MFFFLPETLNSVSIYVCQAVTLPGTPKKKKSSTLRVCGNDKHLLSISAEEHTNLVCLHKKVWIGNGTPFPHSGSFSSRLFLFTILAEPCPPACVRAPGRALAAATGSAQVTSDSPSRHDWVRPA